MSARDNSIVADSLHDAAIAYEDAATSLMITAKYVRRTTEHSSEVCMEATHSMASAARKAESVEALIRARGQLEEALKAHAKMAAAADALRLILLETAAKLAA